MLHTNTTSRRRTATTDARAPGIVPEDLASSRLQGSRGGNRQDAANEAA